MTPLFKIQRLFVRYALFSVCMLFALCQAELVSADPASDFVTAEERAWLQAHPVIRLGVDPDFAPFEWVDDNGTYMGLAADYMDLLAERLGITFRVEPNLSWDEAAIKGRGKELDIHPLMTPTEERKKTHLFTQTYVRDPYVIIGRDDHVPIANEAGLANKKVALVRGYSATELLLKNQPDVIPVYVETELESLLAVVAGEVDATVGHLGTLAEKIRQNHLANLTVVARTKFKTKGMGIAVRNDWPVLRDLLDRALDSVTQQEHREINQRWMQIAEIETSAAIHVPLTAEEREWLAVHPVIRVASDPDWAPLEFIGAEGELQGVSRDYLDKLEEMLGIRFESGKNLTWQQAVEKVKRHELDMFSSFRQTPERQRFVSFTDEYVSQPIMIFARDDVTYIGGLGRLKGWRVAAIESYAIHELLASQHSDIELIPAPTIENALRMLAAGEVDAFVGNIITTTYYLNKLGLSQIKVVGETPYRNRQAMAARKDWPLLVSILDKALKAIPQDDHTAIQQRWMPVTFDYEADYSWLWKPFLVMGLIVAVIFYWNRRLAREVVARKETELALKAQQQRLDDIFNVTPSGIWDWDMKTDICFCSPAYFEILGYEAQEFSVNDVNSVWLDLVHPEDKAQILAVHEAAATSDEPFSKEYRLRCKDGSYKWILDRGQVVSRSVSGQPTRMIGSYVDIDASKQLEKQLRDAKEDAEAANLAKSTFLANMSHELRTPLNAVLGFSELMTHDELMTLAQIDNLNMINSSGQHLLNLINDVLDMSKIEAGHATLDIETTDLHRLLDDVENMMKGRALSKGLSFTMERQSAVPQFVKIDGGKVKQILINLLGNAIKFTQKGSVVLTINAEQGVSDQWLLSLAVKDTGVGISKEKCVSIFEPFIQTGPCVNGQNGTGLGLAISSQFAELMGGVLSVDSELGQGSLFSLQISAMADEAVIEPDVEERQTIISLAEDEPEWRILIVEDQASNRALLRSQLEQVGFKVHEAHNGQQGVEAFLNWQPHLIWMDMRMPVMDGYEATRRIRALPGGQEVKIFALTASAFQEEASGIIAAGCDEVHNKPYFEQDILAAMGNNLPLHYLYRTGNADLVVNHPELKSDDVQVLPTNIIAPLLGAAKMGDIAQLQVLTRALPAQYSSLQDQLNRYINDFELQAVIDVLESIVE